MTAQELTAIIKSGDYPKVVNSYQRHRITELYEAGNTWDAIRKLQGILEKPISPKDKTLL